jgi:hypothetical protein
MSTNHVVISRYNEDLSWLESIDRSDSRIFIYNKGQKINNMFPGGVTVIDLENTGRESHTYLYHILNNYEELPEKIIFSQAHPNDHVSPNFKSEFFEFLNGEEEFRYFSSNTLEMKILEDGVEESGNLNGSYWKNKHSLSSCCVTIPFELIHQIESKKWIFGTGAIFGVSRRSILKNSKEFYQMSLEILEKSSDRVNPPEGHAFERSWYLIFNQ